MKKNTIIIYISFLFLLLISACKVGKNYQRPDLLLPKELGSVSYADTSSIADLKWNEFFSDTTLQRLIDKGIRENYDLQLAIKRIDIARQQLMQARLLMVPQANVVLGAQTNRPSKNSVNGLSTSTFLGKDHIENYNAALNLSWEADIWGKIRRQKETVLAQYLQSTEAKKAVQTQLVSEISSAYYNLLMLDKQLSIARKNLSLSDSTLQLTRLLKDAGEVSELAVQQADAQRQATALLVPQLQQNISLQENAIQILTASLPGSLSRHTIDHLAESLKPLSTGLPLALISRRPDVRANELELVAANAYAGVAQANMYPSLVIGVSGGLESFKASNWFNIPSSLFGVAGASLLQPVFRSRSLKTQYETAKIQREQAVLVFRKSVLNALGEVSDALIQAEKLTEQEQIASDRVNTLQGAIKNARLLFKSDLANYLEVITAQSTVLQAELDLALIHRQQLVANVEIYRALGGGWK